jgi:hypothetical protein
MGNGFDSGGFRQINWRSLVQKIIGAIVLLTLGLSAWIGVELLGHDRTITIHEERIKTQEKAFDEHLQQHLRLQDKLEEHFKEVNAKLDNLKGWTK